MINARVDHIDALVLNTPDVLAACAFYVAALGFTIEGAFGEKEARLRLGDQAIGLTRPEGNPRPYPLPRAANDPWFQHFAIVVSDMPAAHARLIAHGAEPISRDGPQRLPPAAGDVTAYKFRDPDGHPLELSRLPASPAWSEAARRRPDAVFLGIDHTALAVIDLDASLAFYRGLGFAEGPRFLNQGPEQDRLDGLAGVSLDIATLATPGGGPHLELLHYRFPAPAAAMARTTSDISATRVDLRPRAGSPGLALQDPDGHRLRFLAGPSRGGGIAKARVFPPAL